MRKSSTDIFKHLLKTPNSISDKSFVFPHQNTPPNPSAGLQDKNAERMQLISQVSAISNTQDANQQQVHPDFISLSSLPDHRKLVFPTPILAN